jgi:hypothetical protein
MHDFVTDLRLKERCSGKINSIRRKDGKTSRQLTFAFEMPPDNCALAADTFQLQEVQIEEVQEQSPELSTFNAHVQIVNQRA